MDGYYPIQELNALHMVYTYCSSSLVGCFLMQLLSAHDQVGLELKSHRPVPNVHFHQGLAVVNLTVGAHGAGPVNKCIYQIRIHRQMPNPTQLAAFCAGLFRACCRSERKNHRFACISRSRFPLPTNCKYV